MMLNFKPTKQPHNSMNKNLSNSKKARKKKRVGIFKALMRYINYVKQSEVKALPKTDFRKPNSINQRKTRLRLRRCGAYKVKR